MNYRTTHHKLPLFALLAIFLMAGCSDSSNGPVSPGIEPEIVNTTDNFQFQVTAMTNYTGTVGYTWMNTGPMADVDQSCALTAGTATLVLRDDSGTQVYSRDLTESGSFVSDTGTGGAWRVEVLLTGASGTLNFRVDMRPLLQ